VMSEWAPIETGKPEVTGDSQYVGLVRVRVPLDPRPDGDWRAIFNSGPPPGVSYSPAKAFPTVESDAVVFRSAPGDVEAYYDQAKRWVEGTNAEYARQVIPARERYLKQKEADEQAQRDAIEEARRRLENVDQG
jgi:hypothetical protein